MTEPFVPTHTIRFTFESGIYGETDVALVADQAGNGRAYRKEEWGGSTSRWEHRDGRWLFEGGTTMQGREIRIEAWEIGAGPTRIELEGTPDQVVAQLEAIERLQRLLRTRPEVDPASTLGQLEQALVQKLAGRWHCYTIDWPMFIRSEIEVLDLEHGLLRQHVEAGGQSAVSELKVFQVSGTTLKVQQRGTLEASEWRLVAHDRLECGDPLRETVLVFEREGE